MNADVVYRIIHLLANLKDIAYSDFIEVKSYLSATEYDAPYSPIFEQVQNFYETRHNHFPDLAWLTRQFPSTFSTYIPADFHADDVYVIKSILREESYRNKVLSSTYNNDLDKSLNLLTEYKQASANIIKAPTSMQEVFKDFEKEQKDYGSGIRTGIDQLDVGIDFLPYKAFTALVAPTKSFKTMTSCNIVYSAVVNQSKNVVYLTLEDQLRSIWANLLCKHSYKVGLPLSTNEIKKYKLSGQRSALFKKIQKNFDDSMKGHLVVLSSETTSSFTPDIVESQLNFYEKLWGKIDMVVVDHLSISDDPIPGMNLSGPALAKAYVRFYTKAAIERNFVFLGLGQVTREYTEKLIKGDKMRSTGVANTSEMERSCNIMLCTYASDEMKKAGTLGITVVVNRDGESDVTYNIPIKPEFASIGDVCTEHLDDSTISSIMYGDMDIPLMEDMQFGISFSQFQHGLVNV